MTQDASGPELEDSGPLTNAGKDFLAGYLRCYDIYFGDVEYGNRLDAVEVHDAGVEARNYEAMINMDPERKRDEEQGTSD